CTFVHTFLHFSFNPPPTTYTYTLSLHDALPILHVFYEKGLKAIDPALALMVFAGAASCNIAIELGVQGPNSTNAMSCASGTIAIDRKSTRLNSSHVSISYAVFCLKKKKKINTHK